MREIDFHWDINVEPLKLGSLLMFRKAVENYLEFQQSGQASLKFICDDWSNESSKRLIKMLFKDSNYNLIFLTGNVINQRNPLNERFNYFSSWYGIEHQIACGLGKQKLNWIKNPDMSFIDYVTCHLRVKRHDEVKQIYHASVKDWFKFFQFKKEQKFLLLGDDPYPNEMLDLQNVEIAKDFSFDLNQQLALIEDSKAFIGSASGIASAAVLSGIPFLVFKHPDHHPWEYITPKFLKENQRQVRQVDSLENILKGNVV